MNDFDLIMDTNVTGAFAFSKYTDPEMVKKEMGRSYLHPLLQGLKDIQMRPPILAANLLCEDWVKP